MRDQNKLLDFLVGEEVRKRRIISAVRVAIAAKTIPVSDEVRDTISALFVADAQEVLRDHPGFDIEDRIRSTADRIAAF